MHNLISGGAIARLARFARLARLAGGTVHWHARQAGVEATWLRRGYYNHHVAVWRVVRWRRACMIHEQRHAIPHQRCVVTSVRALRPWRCRQPVSARDLALLARWTSWPPL